MASMNQMPTASTLPAAAAADDDDEAQRARADVRNNQRLRDLVDAAGVSPAVALTLFNRGLGAGAHSASAWKALLASPTTDRFRPLDGRLLAHAERAFAQALRPQRRGIQA